MPVAARCRSSRTPARADDMRARSRPAVGLPEVQEGWEASGSDIAPAIAALAPSVAGRLNAKRYAPVVVQMSRVGGSNGTSELGPFTPR